MNAALRYEEMIMGSERKETELGRIDLLKYLGWREN